MLSAQIGETRVSFFNTAKREVGYVKFLLSDKHPDIILTRIFVNKEFRGNRLAEKELLPWFIKFCMGLKTVRQIDVLICPVEESGDPGSPIYQHRVQSLIDMYKTFGFQVIMLDNGDPGAILNI